MNRCMHEWMDTIDIIINQLPGGVGGLEGSDRVMQADGCTGADELNTSEADRLFLSRLLLFDLPLNLAFEGVFTALMLPEKMDPPILLLLLLRLPTIGLSRDDDDDDDDTDSG